MLLLFFSHIYKVLVSISRLCSPDSVLIRTAAVFSTILDNAPHFNASVFCLFSFDSQESPVREPSESELCKPARLRTQHHRQSAIYERRGPKQRHAGTSPWHHCYLSQSLVQCVWRSHKVQYYSSTQQLCLFYLFCSVQMNINHIQQQHFGKVWRKKICIFYFL